MNNGVDAAGDFPTDTGGYGTADVGSDAGADTRGDSDTDAAADVRTGSDVRISMDRADIAHDTAVDAGPDSAADAGNDTGVDTFISAACVDDDNNEQTATELIEGTPALKVLCRGDADYFGYDVPGWCLARFTITLDQALNQGAIGIDLQISGGISVDGKSTTSTAYMEINRTSQTSSARYYVRVASGTIVGEVVYRLSVALICL